MTVFVDTGVFYAHHDTDAARHEVGATALTTLLKSAEYGRVLTSDYVYDETVTLTQRRTGSISAAKTVGQRIRGDGYPDAIEILYASPQLFERAVETYDQYSDHQLSFTDAMTVVMVEFHGIDAVVSFDDDFDGIVDRRAPATIAGAYE